MGKIVLRAESPTQTVGHAHVCPLQPTAYCMRSTRLVAAALRQLRQVVLMLVLVAVADESPVAGVLVAVADESAGTCPTATSIETPALLAGSMLPITVPARCFPSLCKRRGVRACVVRLRVCVWGGGYVCMCVWCGVCVRACARGGVVCVHVCVVWCVHACVCGAAGL
jgi:hypothetical protein